MISSLRKRSLHFIHPLLKRLANIYLSKPRNYKHKGISVKVLPGVFHPGLFLSTKIFIEFLETIELKDKKVLELGAGSGLISLYCARKHACVTASDINTTAIEGIRQNALENNENVQVVLSDLFDSISVNEFDIILINPPYYAKTPKSIEENAWFCGSEFEYFYKLFNHLGKVASHHYTVFMILSEDCQINKILSIARENNLSSELVFSKKVKLENNYIYKIGSKTL